MELKGKKINFLGDSITQGVGTTASDKIYLNLLKEKAGLFEARNYGISGTRIAKQQGEDTVGEEFSKRFSQMDNDADIIVIFGGTNDFGHGNAKIGCIDDKTNDTFYGAWHVLLSGLIKKYPRSQIIIMTPTHRIGENIKNESNGATLKQYVDVIREMAEYYSVPVIDLYKESGIMPEIEEQKEIFMPDGLHPSDAGNERIYQKLYAFLKAL